MCRGIRQLIRDLSGGAILAYVPQAAFGRETTESAIVAPVRGDQVIMPIAGKQCVQGQLGRIAPHQCCDKWEARRAAAGRACRQATEIIMPDDIAISTRCLYEDVPGRPDLLRLIRGEGGPVEKEDGPEMPKGRAR